jgi:predicted deacylase
MNILAHPGQVSAAEPFQIGEIVARSGEMSSGFLVVPDGVDKGTRIPVTLIHGKKPGPVLALMAGHHGTEYVPIIALQRMRKKIDPGKLSGKVIIVHVADRPAFEGKLVLDAPTEGKNLNRSYPGNPQGTVKERIAHVITTQVIDRADYVLDMHGGPANISHMPIGLVWSGSGDKKVDRVARDMALVFGFRHIVVEKIPGGPKGCKWTDCTALIRGKPAFSSESGQLGQVREEWVEMAERGIWNLLKYFRMWPGEVSAPEKSVKSVDWYNAYKDVTSPESGVFFPSVKLGDKVKKGMLLGKINDLFGKESAKVKSPFRGVICCMVIWPSVLEGDTLFCVCTR